MNYELCSMWQSLEGDRPLWSTKGDLCFLVKIPYTLFIMHGAWCHLCLCWQEGERCHSMDHVPACQMCKLTCCKSATFDFCRFFCIHSFSFFPQFWGEPAAHRILYQAYELQIWPQVCDLFDCCARQKKMLQAQTWQAGTCLSCKNSSHVVLLGAWGGEGLQGLTWEWEVRWQSVNIWLKL